MRFLATPYPYDLDNDEPGKKIHFDPSVVAESKRFAEALKEDIRALPSEDRRQRPTSSPTAAMPIQPSRLQLSAIRTSTMTEQETDCLPPPCLIEYRSVLTLFQRLAKLTQKETSA